MDGECSTHGSHKNAIFLLENLKDLDHSKDLGDRMIVLL
jgi:hypothetical protein